MGDIYQKFLVPVSVILLFSFLLLLLRLHISLHSITCTMSLILDILPSLLYSLSILSQMLRHSFVTITLSGYSSYIILPSYSILSHVSSITLCMRLISFGYILRMYIRSIISSFLSPNISRNGHCMVLSIFPTITLIPIFIKYHYILFRNVYF